MRHHARTNICALLCLVGVCVLGAGCASGPSSVRFVNRDPVWQVDDRKPTTKPEDNPFRPLTSGVHDAIRRPVIHGLGVPAHPRAKNTNSLGEVPDSTWFTNRIGIREMSASEVAHGPNDTGPPEPPCAVIKAKTTGAAPGMFVRDARGIRYLIKFDPKPFPETETGTDVVVQRLLWAVGYHVPEDYVVRFQRDDLYIADGATRTLDTGRKVPLEKGRIEHLLTNVAKSARGAGWRALASKMLEGEPLGGWPMTGVRQGDPNDRVPHEHRRDVRGQHTFFAWLKHTDMKEDNSLDMWIEQPEGSGKGYVRHHLIDFGKALGVKGRGGGSPHDGWQHKLDYAYAGASLLTFGLWRRPWEGIPASDLRGVGRYQAEYYEPEMFHVTRPYAPYFYTDRFDAYWASKILIRLSRAHIDAAVRQGKFSQPRARAYLVDTIVARQRKTARHWFRQVNPVDYVRVQRDREHGGWRLCAEDLMIAHGLGGAPATTRYTLRAYGADGAPLGWTRELAAAPSGRLCAGGLRPPSSNEGYTIVHVRTDRGDGTSLPLNEVHLARRSGGGRYRVIGMWRR